MILRVTSPQFSFEGGRAFVIGANSLAMLAEDAPLEVNATIRIATPLEESIELWLVDVTASGLQSGRRDLITAMRIQSSIPREHRSAEEVQVVVGRRALVAVYGEDVQGEPVGGRKIFLSTMGANGSMEMPLDPAGRAQLLLEPGVHMIGLRSISARPVCGESRHARHRIEVPVDPSDDPMVVRLQDLE